MAVFDRAEVHGEIEAALAAGTFMLTHVLNEEDTQRRQAGLEYLHGTGPDKRPDPVSVRIEVTHEIVKNRSHPVKVSGKVRFVGGSIRMPSINTKAGPIPLRRVIAPGVYTMGTAQATELLFSYGADTTRVILKPENRRKAYCRELPPAGSEMPEPVKRGPGRPRNESQAASAAG